MSSYSDYIDAITRIYGQQAAAQAQATQAVGQAQAQAAQQRGQLWGQAIGNLGQVGAQIPQAIQTAQIQGILKQNNGDLEASLPAINQINPTMGSEFLTRLMNAKKLQQDYLDAKQKNDIAQQEFRDKQTDRAVGQLVNSASQQQYEDNLHGLALAIGNGAPIGIDVTHAPTDLNAPETQAWLRSLAISRMSPEQQQKLREPKEVKEGSKFVLTPDQPGYVQPPGEPPGTPMTVSENPKPPSNPVELALARVHKTRTNPDGTTRPATQQEMADEAQGYIDEAKKNDATNLNAQADEKRRQLGIKQDLGQPLTPEEQFFNKEYDRQKMMVPEMVAAMTASRQAEEAKRANDLKQQEILAHKQDTGRAELEKLETQTKQVMDTANLLRQTVAAARAGNKYDAQAVPVDAALTTMKALGFNRASPDVARQFANAGSMWDKLKGRVFGAISGNKLDEPLMNDMTAYADQLEAQAKSNYARDFPIKKERYDLQDEEMKPQFSGMPSPSGDGGPGPKRGDPPPAGAKPIPGQTGIQPGGTLRFDDGNTYRFTGFVNGQPHYEFLAPGQKKTVNVGGQTFTVR